MSSDDSLNVLVEEYGLTSKDASTLLVLDDGDRLDYYFSVVESLKIIFAENVEVLARIGKVAGNWYVHPCHTTRFLSYNSPRF